MLLTDDGDFANKVMHPRYEVEKEYEALVTSAPPSEAIESLRAGIVLDGRTVRPERVRLQNRGEQHWVTLVVREGRKHEVRRLLGAVGLTVRRLVRTRIGPVRLGALPVGGHRPLSTREVEGLFGPADQSRHNKA